MGRRSDHSLDWWVLILQIEVEFGRFQKDVWAFSPLRNKTVFTNSEGKLSRHIGFGRKIWLSFDKKHGMMLLYLHEKGRRKHCL